MIWILDWIFFWKCVHVIDVVMDVILILSFVISHFSAECFFNTWGGMSSSTWASLISPTCSHSVRIRWHPLPSLWNSSLIFVPHFAPRWRHSRNWSVFYCSVSGHVFYKVFFNLIQAWLPEVCFFLSYFICDFGGIMWTRDKCSN